MSKRKIIQIQQKKDTKTWIDFYKQHNQFFMTNETSKKLSHNERKVY